MTKNEIAKADKATLTARFEAICLANLRLIEAGDSSEGRQESRDLARETRWIAKRLAEIDAK